MNRAHRVSKSKTCRNLSASEDRIEVGKLTAMVTDGHFPYPYGRETTGYEVTNLTDTLTKPKQAASTCSYLRIRPTNGKPLSCNSPEDTSRKSTP